MEAFAPYASWLGGVINKVAQPVLDAGFRASSPVLPAPMAGTVLPVSLGLKVLLEPTTGGILFRAASNTVATIYPVYASAKAIESKDSKDDVQWLTYWTLYGSIILAEHLADQALSKVPYYYHAKFAALLWLQLPQTRGASYLYNRFYKPLLAKYSGRIDSILAKGQSLLTMLYSAYKVPIDAFVALLVELRKQAAAGLTWLLADDGAKKGQDGAKAGAA